MMSLPRASRRLSAAVAATLLAALVLTSCGDSDDSGDATGDDPTPTGSSQPSDSPSDSPSASSPQSTEPSTVSSAPPSESDEATDPAATDESDLLLTADEMPGLNDQTTWQEKSTEPESGEPFGDCAKFGLVDSGADSATIRTFTAPDTQYAAQLVATFADAKSAWRGEQVLRGWHRDCAEQLDAGVEKINPIEKLKVPAGQAFTYLLQFGPKDAEVHHFNAVAVNRVGNHVSVVLIDVEGQDYNYPAGQHPAEQAARAVAKKLG